MKNDTFELIGFKNTRSEAGNATRYELNYGDIVRATVWVNSYGNPSYMLYMSNGETFFTVDNYGINRSSLPNLQTVYKKKHL